MPGTGTLTRKPVRQGSRPQFSSRLSTYISAILRMRYQENRTVREVLGWLRDQDCPISRYSYQEFMRRVLRLLPVEQARDLGVDVEILRTIRVRLKMPINPRRARSTTIKPLPRHNARTRRRPIVPRPKNQPRPVPPRTPHRSSVPPAKTALALVVEPLLPPKMRGTPEDPQGYGDWKIINDMARKKVFAKDRSMMLNYMGTVTHTKTRHEWTQAELEVHFGLTPNEAESCFMTFTASEKR